MVNDSYICITQYCTWLKHVFEATVVSTLIPTPLLLGTLLHSWFPWNARWKEIPASEHSINCSEWLFAGRPLVFQSCLFRVSKCLVISPSNTRAVSHRAGSLCGRPSSKNQQFKSITSTSFFFRLRYTLCIFPLLSYVKPKIVVCQPYWQSRRVGYECLFGPYD